ncbi:MAG: EAL domain-containing protein [Burkholderiales bacterium]|nr:EAL domain-containing protein [Burkholderiales bacterium]MDR4517585.1 EAL domain-containing protein [Nitrosomonas sp.]
MFKSATIDKQVETHFHSGSEFSAPDADQLGQLVNRFAWLTSIVAALSIPVLVMIYSYMTQYLLVVNEASMLSEIAKSHEQQNSERGSYHTFEQILNAVSRNNESEVTLNETDSIESQDRLQKSIPIHFADGSSAMLTVSRSLHPVFADAAIGLIAGLLIGFLVFRVIQIYPCRVFNIAMKELKRRAEAEHRLRATNSLFSAILESTDEGIVAIDGEGRVVACNTRYLELWRLPENEFKKNADCMFFSSLATHVRDPKCFLQCNEHLLNKPTSELIECLELRDGRFFEWTSRPQRIHGKVVGRISTFRDVSESRRAEVLLSTEKTVLEKLVQGAPLEDALFVVADVIERESGDMFCAILFCRDGRTNDLNAVAGTRLPPWYCDRLLTLSPRLGQRKNDLQCINTDSPSSWFESGAYSQLMSQAGVGRINLELIKGSAGNVIGLVLAHYRNETVQCFEQDRQLLHIAGQMCSVAVDRYHTMRELDLLAHYDFLTELPNRKCFHDHLNNAIEQAQGSGRSLGLLFLDLDRFKAINDSLGHSAGDALLKVVASRIRESVREQDIVARLSGDEFVVLIEDLQQTEIATELASKIAARMTEGVNLHGQRTFISASVGIAVYPQDGKTLEELLKNADTAMYEAKEQGRNGVQFFHTRMNENHRERLRLEERLSHALECNEMTLHYQPKVQASTMTVIGAEALLRWQHPKRGLLPPSEFVPLLEETGLIDEYWKWIIRKVCEDMLSLDEASRNRLDIAVNVSARQFGNYGLHDSLARVIDSTGINPNRLELELTESLLMKEPQQASRILGELRELGIGGIAIDDFGTGYSSLACLKGFPVTALKIDRSFVSGIAHGNQDEAIVQAIMALAQSLGLRVTAEGVETFEQAASLTAQGCHEFQGYYFGKPASLERFISTMNNGFYLINGTRTHEMFKVIDQETASQRCIQSNKRHLDKIIHSV